MPLLVGLSPLTLDVTSRKPAPAPAVGDEEDFACLQTPGGEDADAGWLGYHTAAKVADKLIRTERSFFLKDEDVREREA